MIGNFQNADQLRRSLERLSIGLGAIVGVALLGTLGTGALAQMAATEALENRKASSKVIAELEAKLKRAESLADEQRSTQRGALERFQQRFEDLAKARKCTVNDYQAANEKAKFLSRYTANPSEGAWLQYSVSFTLTGRMSEVLETMQSIKQIRVPVELDSVELNRVGIGEDHASVVSAKVVLRVLEREAI